MLRRGAEGLSQILNLGGSPDEASPRSLLHSIFFTFHFLYYDIWENLTLILPTAGLSLFF